MNGDYTDELSLVITTDSKGSNFVGPDSQRAFNEAEKLGLEIVLPDDNTLQIDIDSVEALGVFYRQLTVVEQHFKGTTHVVKQSKSGKPGKFHITVTLPLQVDMYQRIALQACLGSDPLRELLSYVQAVHGDPHPTLFFEKKPALLTENAIA
jgi:hypothetical protein